MLINPQHWPILSRLLDEALEMPPEARERWLEALPPADRPIRRSCGPCCGTSPRSETGDFLDILPNLRDAVDNARAAVSARP